MEKAAFLRLFSFYRNKVNYRTFEKFTTTKLMLITTKAIVLSALKFGEADLIAKCFTEKSGLKTYLLRGILKSKKGKLKASLFQPLTQLEIVAQHKDKGNLEYVREAKLVVPYQSLHTDIMKSSVVIFISEVLRNAIREEETNPSLYNFIESSLNWFDSHEKTANFHPWFLLELTKFLGFYPDDNQENNEVFNLRDGTFQKIKTNSDCVADENITTLKRFLGTNFDEFSHIKMNQITRSGFLLLLLNYYEIHLQGFQKPKSLAVLNEIYN